MSNEMFLNIFKWWIRFLNHKDSKTFFPRKSHIAKSNMAAGEGCFFLSIFFFCFRATERIAFHYKLVAPWKLVKYTTPYYTTFPSLKIWKPSPCHHTDIFLHLSPLQSYEKAFQESGGPRESEEGFSASQRLGLQALLLNDPTGFTKQIRASLVSAAREHRRREIRVCLNALHTFKTTMIYVYVCMCIYRRVWLILLIVKDVI